MLTDFLARMHKGTYVYSMYEPELQRARIVQLIHEEPVTFGVNALAVILFWRSFSLALSLNCSTHLSISTSCRLLSTAYILLRDSHVHLSSSSRRSQKHPAEIAAVITPLNSTYTTEGSFTDSTCMADRCQITLMVPESTVEGVKLGRVRWWASSGIPGSFSRANAVASLPRSSS